MDKRAAGKLGGLATLAKHGPDHFRAIGRRGAAVTRSRYRLDPVGPSGWAMVDRQTNRVRAFIHFIPPWARDPHGREGDSND